jgi:folate-binding protein YgfZ
MNLTFSGRSPWEVFEPLAGTEQFLEGLKSNGAVEITDDLYETLRIESGIPKYGVDMDETTIVPELGLDGLISYNKGCYIGQEIIARIYFRGHVAKRLTGLMSEPGAIATGFLPGAELTTEDGKNAGRITSVTYSPKLGKTIALAYVRYDYLEVGTALILEGGKVTVTDLPFIN